ncbi:DUF4189 domain-containing protein [Xanthomonas graminis]|uniref:DUF4189 domain-containing protein n=1 Tax=Xanthomonas graminis TaxID=3390026 RepID=UPI0009BB3AFF|nr:DUF4189 domain-containing protein [Xanthomonas translucens]UKE66037.1 DUF4189 domain-containing protein [Xanthomonas translucens pv. phlei]
MLNFFRLPLVLLCFLFLIIGHADAEQGCPPGQYPIGGQGAAACAPIPQESPIQQSPRPTGKWIKTWGAIASDGGDNLGVSTGKIEKSAAVDDAIAKCSLQSGKECRLAFSYNNQCTAIAEPYRDENAISGALSFGGAPSKDIASKDVLSNCKKNNDGADCRIIYTACSEPIFKKY